MEIAYLILAHKDPVQIIELIDILDSKNSKFILHIDKKSKKMYDYLKNELKNRKNVFMTEKRYKVYWAGYSIINATMECMKTPFDKNMDFDYAVLISGQDYPIKSNKKISLFLRRNNGKIFIDYTKIPDFNRWPHLNGGIDRIIYKYYSFGGIAIRIPRTLEELKLEIEGKIGLLIKKISLRVYYKLKQKIKVVKKKKPKKEETLKKDILENIEFYGGNQWWAFPKHIIGYIIDYTNKNRKFIRFLKKTSTPDELFFQTLIMNSQFKKEVINDDLHLLKWPKRLSKHPEIIKLNDFEDIKGSKKLFARKFDYAESRIIIRKIKNEIINK